jgi:hypothetical protein
LPHERAEVSVLEVLRQQLAGELVRLVNRELRAPLGPRHDVVASRVVHHVVPASERGWASVSGAPSRDKTAPSATRRQPNVYRSATRARTLYAGRAAPPRPSWTPSRPGVRLSPSRPPLERRRASRGALCARTGVDARPEYPCATRERNEQTKNFPFAFPEKSVDIGGHERRGQLARWHEWPERSDSRSDR